MAKIKFPLEMAEGVQVRSLDELKENFDIQKVIGYFLNGKLYTWLTDRYYEDLAEQVEALSKEDSELEKKLCEIFGVEYNEESKVDAEEIAKRNERIAKLKQFTDDEEVIQNIDKVAFNQEELADLYDNGAETIYLCEGEFNIPKSKQDLKYIELGGATVKGKIVIPDKVEFEVKKRYLFDSKRSESKTNKNGDVYNVLVKSIYLKNITKGTEVLVTDEFESAKEHKLVDGCIFYLNDDGDINKISKNGEKILITNTDNEYVEIVHADTEKLVWRSGFSTYNYFVKYYCENKFKKIVSCRSHSDIEKYIYKDSFYYLDLHDFYQIDMKTMKSKCICHDTKKIKLFDDKLIIVRQNGSDNNFYEISAETLDEKYITLAYSKNSFERSVADFDIKNDKLIWLFAKGKDVELFATDLNTHKTTKISEFYTEMLTSKNISLDDEWIYIKTNPGFGIGIETIDKIRYDGTGKERVSSRKRDPFKDYSEDEE